MTKHQKRAVCAQLVKWLNHVSSEFSFRLVADQLIVTVGDQELAPKPLFTESLDSVRFIEKFLGEENFQAYSDAMARRVGGWNQALLADATTRTLAVAEVLGITRYGEEPKFRPATFLSQKAMEKELRKQIEVLEETIKLEEESARFHFQRESEVEEKLLEVCECMGIEPDRFTHSNEGLWLASLILESAKQTTEKMG